MSHVLRPDEPLEAAVRRLAGQRLAALAALLRTAADLAGVVHETRKGCKRLRALTRLVGSGLGEEAARRLDTRFRDAQRHLAPLRDAWIVVAAAGNLDRASRGRGGETRAAEAGEAPGGGAGVLPRLRRRYRELSHREAEVAEAVAAVVAMVERTRAELPQWRLEGSTDAVVAAGLERVYGRSRRELDEAARGGSATAFHQWRKRVKYLVYQLELLGVPAGAASPDDAPPDSLRQPGGVDVDGLVELADLLGDLQDLAVLRCTIEELIDGPEAAALLARIEWRSGELKGAALEIGRPLHRPAPAAFVRAVVETWRGAPAAPARGDALRP